MIICDICKEERKPDERMNVIQLYCYNAILQPPIEIEEYHLCIRCAQKVNKEIKELIE